VKAEGSWPYPYCWYGFWFSVFDSWSVPSVSCEGEAEYAPAETVGLRLRFWFGEGLDIVATLAREWVGSRLGR
jgi:hypothetical protein